MKTWKLIGVAALAVYSVSISAFAVWQYLEIEKYQVSKKKCLKMLGGCDRQIAQLKGKYRDYWKTKKPSVYTSDPTKTDAFLSIPPLHKEKVDTFRGISNPRLDRENK